jgi:hypothetical protein
MEPQAVPGIRPQTDKSFMKLPFTGGCACGAIGYECNAEPIMMGKCHCRDCQHLSGGPFVPFVIVPTEAFRLTRGKIQYHFTKSLKNGKHKRGFCAQCGSRLTGAESETPSAIIGIVAGSLDDPSWFRPQMDIFPPTRSRGIKWIQRFQNTRSILRRGKTADSVENPAKNCPN